MDQFAGNLKGESARRRWLEYLEEDRGKSGWAGLGWGSLPSGLVGGRPGIRLFSRRQWARVSTECEAIDSSFPVILNYLIICALPNVQRLLILKRK